MNESDKRIVRNCLPQLTRAIIFDVRFQDLLVTKRVFSAQMMRDIKRNQNPQLELLLALMRRGPNDFQRFMDALVETQQQHAVQILQDGRQNISIQVSPADPLYNPYPNWRTSLPAPLENYTPRPSISGENGQVYRSNSTAESRLLNPPNYEAQVPFIPIPTPEIELSEPLPDLPSNNTFPIYVQPSSTFKGAGDPGVYPCSLDEPRGLALILNYRNIPNHELRAGSELDVHHLQELLKQLGYKVISHSDLNFSETRQAIKDFSQRSEHEKADSTIIVIMSHGEDGSVAEGTRFFTSDGNCMGSEIVIEQFSNHDCPDLVGKPKMFLFQFCRGNRHDIPRSPPGKIDVDGASIQHASRPMDMRSFSDILIANSTLPGYVSYRETDEGTWFVKAICLMFMEHARDYHVQKLLNKVDQCIQQWAANKSGKQTVDINIRAFSKKFFFNPGLIGGGL